MFTSESAINAEFDRRFRLRPPRAVLRPVTQGVYASDDARGGGRTVGARSAVELVLNDPSLLVRGLLDPLVERALRRAQAGDLGPAPLPWPREVDAQRLLAEEPFQLPYDIYYEVERERERARHCTEASSDLPSPFLRTRSNAYDGGAPVAPAPERCGCERPCGESCLNWRMRVECTQKSCRHGARCGNRRFQRCSYARMAVVYMGDKGWGLVATAPVACGAFVIEYQGEIVDQGECKRRVELEYANERCHYLCALAGHLVVDATRMGNRSRFLNHSCEPSCAAQLWTVRGRPCLGIFALRDVAEGEEITFDYQFERAGSARQACHCGAASCRGYIGTGRDGAAGRASARAKAAAAAAAVREQAIKHVAGALRAWTGPARGPPGLRAPAAGLRVVVRRAGRRGTVLGTVVAPGSAPGTLLVRFAEDGTEADVASRDASVTREAVEDAVAPAYLVRNLEVCMAERQSRLAALVGGKEGAAILERKFGVATNL